MFLNNIIVLITLVLTASGSPLEVQVQNACNLDSCLRELRETYSSAAPYCSTYYTSKTTTTTTTTVPALDATFPVFKKRSPTSAPELQRTTTPPSFAESCTSAPTALSSGCSCLLGSHAATTTKTIYNATSTLPLPPQCSSTNSYGLYPQSLSLEIDSLPLGSTGLGFEVYPGGCCAYCFASPNCIAYNENLNYNATVPGNVGCSISIYGSPSILELGEGSCPSGTATLSVGPVETGIRTLFGMGNCGVPDDEGEWLWLW